MVWFILYLIGLPIFIGFVLTYEDGKLLGDGWKVNLSIAIFWPFYTLVSVGWMTALLMQKIVPAFK